RGAHVTIILPSKDSHAFALRSSDLDMPESFAAAQHQSSMQRLLLVRKAIPDYERNMKVYLHNAIPPVLIIQADNRAFLGLYLHNKQVSDNFLLEITKLNPHPEVMETVISDEIQALLRRARLKV